MLLYCNRGSCVAPGQDAASFHSCLSWANVWQPQSCLALWVSSVVLLSSKSVVPRVHGVALESVPEDSNGAVRSYGYSRVHSSLMAGSCFSMNRLISTISCRDINENKKMYNTERNQKSSVKMWLFPTLTSGQALWGRPRYDLKVMLAGLMRPFIFSAVWLPNIKGTRGSASPWHCRTCMSLLALLAAAWE